MSEQKHVWPDNVTRACPLVIRELKQTPRRRKRERHLKMWLDVPAIIFQLFKLIMLEKCVLTILKLNWNKRLGHKKTKLNICHHRLSSSTQLQNRSFHVVERTRTSSKCQKMTNARAKRAKILFFIVKYANLWAFCCRRRRGCLSSLLGQPQWQRRRRKTVMVEWGKNNRAARAAHVLDNYLT